MANMQAKTVKVTNSNQSIILSVPCVASFDYQTPGSPKIAVAINRTVRDIKTGEYARGYAVTHVASGQRMAYLTTLKRLPIIEMIADATAAIDTIVQRVGLERFNAKVTSAPTLPHPKDKPMRKTRDYRYQGPYGWIMIGARNPADALREAQRSITSNKVLITNLQVWNGETYIPVTEKGLYSRTGTTDGNGGGTRRNDPTDGTCNPVRVHYTDRHRGALTMIKSRDIIPPDVSRRFRLWHERAIGTPEYLARSPVPTKKARANRMLLAKIRADARKYHPERQT